jgi:hypothetical protein
LIIIGFKTNSHAQTKGEPIIINFVYAPEKIQQGDISLVRAAVTRGPEEFGGVPQGLNRDPCQETGGGGFPMIDLALK